MRVLARELGAARPRRAPAGGDVRVLRKEERVEPALLDCASKRHGINSVICGEHNDAKFHGDPPVAGIVKGMIPRGPSYVARGFQAPPEASAPGGAELRTNVGALSD